MGSGNGLGGCFSCMKYVMFGFNLIFWLVGCALVGFGIWVLVDDTFKKLVTGGSLEAIQYAGIAIVVVGCVTMVVGFFGCCGAIKESQCLLTTFFIIMFILFAGLVAGGAICIVYKTEVINKATDAFISEIRSYNEQESDLVNTIQAVFKCCGAENYEAEYKNFIQQFSRLPNTCPKDEDTSAKVAEGTLGCKEQITKYLDEYGIIVGGVAIGVGVVMLIGMIFAILLCCAIRDSFDD